MKKDSTTNIDWGELLDYLLEEISSKMPPILTKNLNAEINTYVTYEKSVDEKKKSIELSVKEKSDKEKFVIAINYLRSLLLETPLIAQEISINLGKLPQKIKFISDTTSINPIKENIEFALTDITLSEDELNVIRTNLDVLYQALEKEEI
ncbi:hypothetical protein FC756_03665 [Lysinibacillus mangiferihumi]|uniref:Uncharacterized protein n=1 Tax=Lysinibacillus mangiferihumi TaxID=1130819 RepID=A0A4V5TMI0_9BACI|nr:hypothetical protein [Lysinibacillus mangiferihumi]TKI71903.1 hypothetical protein FC756_03665 [Lysinibacillus mangiferihumi]